MLPELSSFSGLDMCLKYIYKFINAINRRKCKTELTCFKLRLIICLPRVVFKGGIADDHIKLSLEPEAASIWCQHVNVGKQPSFCKTGNKYMVVDLGGALILVTIQTCNTCINKFSSFYAILFHVLIP